MSPTQSDVIFVVACTFHSRKKMKNSFCNVQMQSQYPASQSNFKVRTMHRAVGMPLRSLNLDSEPVYLSAIDVFLGRPSSQILRHSIFLARTRVRERPTSLASGTTLSSLQGMTALQGMRRKAFRLLAKT